MLVPMNTNRDLRDWLTQLGHRNVQPVTVDIDGQLWTGARYTRVSHYAPDMLAVQRGDKREGEEYSQEFIYCLGPLPKVYVKAKGYRDHGKAVCFPCDGLDWYVAGYVTDISPQYASSHPFGPNFLLCPWDIEGGKIDDYSPKPYARFPLTVIGLSPDACPPAPIFAMLAPMVLTLRQPTTTLTPTL